MDTLSEGSHSVEVSHTDKAGNTLSSTHSFTVDLTNPTVTISSPANGATLTDNTPILTYSISDTNEYTDSETGVRIAWKHGEIEGRNAHFGVYPNGDEGGMISFSVVVDMDGGVRIQKNTGL